MLAASIWQLQSGDQDTRRRFCMPKLGTDTAHYCGLTARRSVQTSDWPDPFCTRPMFGTDRVQFRPNRFFLLRKPLSADVWTELRDWLEAHDVEAPEGLPVEREPRVGG